jgi:succinoglycan biosynthesis protein ExoV
MRVYHWKPDRGENFGDYLSVVILRALGVKPEPPVADEPSLFAIGAILSTHHYRAAEASKVIVWGSGAGQWSADDPPLDFRAVRGPITRDLFRLPVETPLGDPALLLPDLVRVSPVPVATMLYVNHVGADPAITPDWADASVDTRLTGPNAYAEALAIVARIAAAKFVAADSLHGAIVAQAYGVPWAPCSTWGQRPTLKWYDWLAYLGVPPPDSFTVDADDAKAWWNRCGRTGRVRDLKPLLDAFPRGGLS